MWIFNRKRKADRVTRDTVLEILPFQSVGPVRFGDTPADVLRALGDPTSEIPRNGVVQRWYNCVQVTFKDDKVQDVGIAPPQSVRYQDIDILGDSVGWQKLCALDGAPLESCGIVVLPKLGISFAGLHDGDDAQRSVGAFKRGLWDEQLSRMNLFDDWR